MGEYKVTSIIGTENIYSDLKLTYDGVTYTRRLHINTVSDGIDGLPPEIDTTITQYALGESKTEHPTTRMERYMARDDLFPQ